MNCTCRYLRHISAGLFAVALVVAGYFLTCLPVLSSSEQDEAASRFRFTRLELPEVPGPEHRNVKNVHPSLQRISAWISSLGAAVALADLDGDGLPNDLCYVDPRTNQVIVAPVPGTSSRSQTQFGNERKGYEPFTLVAEDRHYKKDTWAPMGCIIGDFNEDGLPDILVYYWGRTPVIFLQKKIEGQAPGELAARNFVPHELVPDADKRADGGRWFTNGCTQADLDGDGHIDIIVGNYFEDGARILDATPESGESQHTHSTMAKAFNGGSKHLFLWQKPGKEEPFRFEEQKGVFSEEVTRGWTLAVGAADLDGDGLPEIYFAHDFGPDRLLHNRSKPGKLEFAVLEGKRDMKTPKSCVMGSDSFKGMGCDFADINGDGTPDIYVSNICTQWGLEESHFLWRSTGDPKHMRERMLRGEAPYVQASEELGLSRSGWGWDCRLADFDNDGVLEAIQAVGFIKGKIDRWPELQALGTANSQLLSNPNNWPRFQPPNDKTGYPGDDLSGNDVDPFFVRGKDGRYYNIVSKMRESGLGEPMVSRGIALADVDGDGRLDFALANQYGPSYFFHNEAPNPGAYLGLHLLLPLRDEKGEKKLWPAVEGHPTAKTPGRPAIGAAATVHWKDGRILTGQVDGGAGHSGRRSPDIHFGLGQLPAGEKIHVVIRWPVPDPEGNKPPTVKELPLDLSPGWHTIQLD